MHTLLETLLASAPPESRKILYFVPYHAFAQPVPGSREHGRWAECEARIAGIAAQMANAHVLDFMIPSEITRYDQNYWDPLHHSAQISERLVALMATGVRRREGIAGAFRYLEP